MGSNDAELQREIAASLEAPPELLPVLPELLADLEALGGSPETAVELLRPLDLEAGSTRVLDLGCGKGAVGLEVARSLGFQVHGIDAFEPFIEHARRRALELGVAELCRFECGDLRQALGFGQPVDVVLYASLGPLLWDLAETVGRLRRRLRPDGYLVIDDGFLAEDARVSVPGYGAYGSRAETLARLTAFGDRLVREVILSSEETKEINQRNTQRIRGRAEVLAQERPELAERLFDYVAEQERQTEILGTTVVCAIWLLRRAG
jgi:2-polyprenyl-3-methyl-5-hydroxy-6-metoxy-1,4-benzoquinol methylase